MVPFDDTIGFDPPHLVQMVAFEHSMQLLSIIRQEIIRKFSTYF